MAVREPKDLLSRLADAGEEAIQRLGETPGADRLLGVAHNLRERLDELQKRVRGIDALERRVAELERRVDELGGKPTTATRKPSSAARKTTGTKASGASAAKRPTTRSPRKGSS